MSLVAIARVVDGRVNPKMSYNQFDFHRVNLAEMARSNSYVISVVTLENGAHLTSPKAGPKTCMIARVLDARLFLFILEY